MSKERLIRTFDLAYDFLRKKINGGLITVDNEASLQLHFSAILKSVGELFEVKPGEFFSIELEKSVTMPNGSFGKSDSDKARIDVFFSFVDVANRELTQSCAVEMKFFKKKNHREPNNRYDVFADIHNLENYGHDADCCFLVVATDHDHYVNQDAYSPNTADFDFCMGNSYEAGTPLTYKTAKPYGMPITLNRSYSFNWDTETGGLHFLKLAVEPIP